MSRRRSINVQRPRPTCKVRVDASDVQCCGVCDLKLSRPFHPSTRTILRPFARLCAPLSVHMRTLYSLTELILCFSLSLSSIVRLSNLQYLSCQSRPHDHSHHTS